MGSKKSNSSIELTFGIPVYNAEKYISDLLDCFKSESKINYEILIINDGSTDKSLSMCMKKRNLNIRIINQKNKGVSYTRNRIIKEARGKYITFIDSDDLIIFDAYEKSYEILSSQDAELLIFSREYSLQKLIEKEIINSPCKKIYSKKLLIDNNIWFHNNISLGEDLLFNLNYYKLNPKIVFCNVEMYIYRKINNASLTLKYRKDKFEELMIVNEECKKMFKEKKIKKSFEYIRIKNCISCIKTEFYHADKEQFKKYVKKIKKYRKKQFLILNDIKSTIIYNIWYTLPVTFIIKISNIMIGGKK